MKILPPVWLPVRVPTRWYCLMPTWSCGVCVAVWVPSGWCLLTVSCGLS